MKGQAAKEQRLIKTMAAFFKARAEERYSFVNGKLPPKQARLMASIIKQATALGKETP